MPLIIQPSNSAKNLILTQMILLLYIHPLPYLSIHWNTYFRLHSRLNLANILAETEKGEKEKYAMRREIVENILRGNGKVCLTFGTISTMTILTAALTIKITYNYMRDTRQLTTFPPHHLTLCPEDICVCGAEWNCLRITNFHLRHFRFVFFCCFFSCVAGKSSHFNFFASFVYVFVCVQFHSIQSSSELLIISHIPPTGRSTASWVFSLLISLMRSKPCVVIEEKEKSLNVLFMRLISRWAVLSWASDRTLKNL